MDRRSMGEDYIVVGMDTTTFAGQYGAIVTSDFGMAVVVILVVWAVVAMVYQLKRVMSTSDEE